MVLLTPRISTFGLLKQIRTNKKWQPGAEPGGHHFVVLNCSINKKPVFFSYVVVNKNGRPAIKLDDHKFNRKALVN